MRKIRAALCAPNVAAPWARRAAARVVEMRAMQLNCIPLELAGNVITKVKRGALKLMCDTESVTLA